MSLIVKNIYLGSNKCSNLDFLRVHNIHTILNISECTRTVFDSSIEYYEFRVRDDDDVDMLKLFDNIAYIIHKKHHNGILVHCEAGVSRSATAVIAYLIRYMQLSYQLAYKLVKSKRSKIEPSPHFTAQLKTYSHQQVTCTTCNNLLL